MIKKIALGIIAGSVLMPHIIKGQGLSWDDEKITLFKDNTKHTLMNTESIFEERWDELAQAQFWQTIMLLSPDSCVVNVAATRQILGIIPVNKWARLTEIEKSAFKYR